jgi:Golgi apparatus protein 1
VENKDHIQNTRCKHVIGKLAQIVFSDYRLLKKFYDACTADVKKFQCGRVDAHEEGVSEVLRVVGKTGEYTSKWN